MHRLDRRWVLAGAAVVVLVALVFGAVLGWPGHPGEARATVDPASTPGALPVTPPGPWGLARWSPVPPATLVPSDTPVQQSYDQALEQGLAASPTIAAAEAASIPAPAVSAAWPPVGPTEDPEAWTEDFVSELLDIDFSRQSRDGLGAWVSAEEAPELLPGVPASVQNKMLYLSLFDAGAVGGNGSPVPDQQDWSALARQGVVWSISDVNVSPDTQWSQILTSGWEPIDERFAVEEVSGVLTATRRGARAEHSFSVQAYLGSAHWQEGYGTALVDDWVES